MLPNFLRVRDVLLAIAMLFVIPSAAMAQQNFFNVPSGSITRADELFVQEQVNLSQTGVSNLTVDYGLGDNWEVGLNLFDLRMYPAFMGVEPGEQDANLILINVQKVFEVNDELSFEFGTQNGLSAASSRQQIEFADFAYTVGRWEAPDRRFGTHVVGGYYGTQSYLGEGNSGGVLLGSEIPISDDVSFVADYLSGTNQASVGVVGLQWTLSERLGWQLSGGVQIPSPGSDNHYGAVIELTKFPPSFRREGNGDSTEEGAEEKQPSGGFRRWLSTLGMRR